MFLVVGWAPVPLGMKRHSMTLREKISDVALMSMLASAAALLLIVLIAKLDGISMPEYVSKYAYLIAGISIYAALTRLMRLRSRKFTFQPIYLLALAAFFLTPFWVVLADTFPAYLAWGLSIALALRITHESEPPKAADA